MPVTASYWRCRPQCSGSESSPGYDR
jgi:hypothetical protein